MKTTFKPFKTHAEFVDEDHFYERTIDGKSETIPNQSLSISEILIKFQNGTLPNIGKNNPYYETDDDYDSDDPTLQPDFDLVDAENYALNMQYRENEKTNSETTQIKETPETSENNDEKPKNDDKNA